jgi:urease accessory protein
MNQSRGPATLLRLLQLIDSGFPTGAFAFSNGLEGLAALEFVRTEAEVRELIETQIHEGLAGIELPAVFAAHRATNLDELKRIDELLSALKPIPAFRVASLKVGRRFLESAAPLIDAAYVNGYLASVREGNAEGHHATAVGIVFQAAGIDAESTALALAASAVQGQTAAAVRLGLIGQSAAQRLISSLQPALVSAVAAAREKPMDEWGAYQPMLDLAGMLQPDLTGRLFAS